MELLDSDNGYPGAVLVLRNLSSPDFNAQFTCRAQNMVNAAESSVFVTIRREWCCDAGERSASIAAAIITIKSRNSFTCKKRIPRTNASVTFEPGSVTMCTNKRTNINISRLPDTSDQSIPATRNLFARPGNLFVARSRVNTNALTARSLRTKRTNANGLHSRFQFKSGANTIRASVATRSPSLSAARPLTYLLWAQEQAECQ